MKSLIVVRAGATSKHPSWSEGSSDCDWDVVVSYFDQRAYEDRSGDEPTYFHDGGKWEGLFQLFSEKPELLDTYDYVWLPDDDLEIQPHSIRLLFTQMREHDLWIAQPALEPQGQVFWPITLQCNGFQLRFTTYVELMAPCFNADFLRHILPFFKGRRTGWGLDMCWCFWTDNPSRRCAIIDEAPMVHPKRVGASGLYRHNKAPFLEKREILSHYSENELARAVTGAILDDGNYLQPGVQLNRLYLWAALRALAQAEDWWRVGRFSRLVVEVYRNSKAPNDRALEPRPIPWGAIGSNASQSHRFGQKPDQSPE